MKGLKDYRFKLVWASSFMGVKAFEQFFYAIGGNLYIRHFRVWAGFKGGVHARVNNVGMEGGGGLLCKLLEAYQAFWAESRVELGI